MEFWTGVFMGVCLTLIFSMWTALIIHENSINTYGNAKALVMECQTNLSRDQYCKVIKAEIVE